MTPIPITKLKGAECLPTNIDTRYSGHYVNGYKIAVEELSQVNLLINVEELAKAMFYAKWPKDRYTWEKVSSELKEVYIIDAKAIASRQSEWLELRKEG